MSDMEPTNATALADHDEDAGCLAPGDCECMAAPGQAIYLGSTREA